MPAQHVQARHDRFGRYVIVDPNTGKDRFWTRATTVAKALEDTYNLNLWSQRQVAKGIGLRPDLYALSVATHIEDKDTLNSVCKQALDAASSGAKANLGTALHSMTERVDRGESMASINAPEPWASDLQAYCQKLDEVGIEIVEEMIERVIVLDELGIAGTFDRLVKVPGIPLPMIADLKGLALDTLLPTPSGWTTMGAVSVGDEVIGSDGRPCTVLVKSDVHWRECYRITFDDTTSVIADADHRWCVRSGVYDAQIVDQVLTTSELAQSLYGYRGQRQHRILNAGALELPESLLPIEPYLLGAWLGDGHTRSGCITKPDPRLWHELKAAGHTILPEQADRRGTHTVEGLGKKLRLAGLTHNKHVPPSYLRSSRHQRLALLQGLMDTDGTWNKPRKQAVFTSTNKQLAINLYELVVSLGWRAILSEVPRFGFGMHVTSYDVAFTPHDESPFRAKRDDIIQRPEGTTKSRRRMVRSVDLVPSVATQCIAVDSPDHTYLCTESMVPTHNTGSFLAWQSFAIQFAIYANADTMFDLQTGKHMPMPEVDKKQALVIHLPVGEAKCDLYLLDIQAGWEALQHAVWVRGWQKRKNLSKPLVIK